jgi:hypothetical protein
MRPEHHKVASLKVRIPRGNAGFWQIIRALHASQGTFTIAHIDGESNVDPHDIKGYVLALARAGFLDVVGCSGNRGATVYRLVRNQNEAPRVRRDGSLILPTAQEQLWTAIRTLKTFGLRDLIFAATTPEVKPTYQSAKRFVTCLATANYLVKRPGRGAERTVWRLKPGMDTGPKPPERRKLHAALMWDPNLGEFVGEAPVAGTVLS